ncbi:MAG: hypothetical protein GY743_18370 [Planctomycetaceae bacterium]|nr:hypothetical protein [Planctomycetaceae bacterium]
MYSVQSCGLVLIVFLTLVQPLSATRVATNDMESELAEEHKPGETSKTLAEIEWVFDKDSGQWLSFSGIVLPEHLKSIRWTHTEGLPPGGVPTLQVTEVISAVPRTWMGKYELRDLGDLAMTITPNADGKTARAVIVVQPQAIVRSVAHAIESLNVTVTGQMQQIAKMDDVIRKLSSELAMVRADAAATSKLTTESTTSLASTQSKLHSIELQNTKAEGIFEAIVWILGAAGLLTVVGAVRSKLTIKN